MNRSLFDQFTRLAEIDSPTGDEEEIGVYLMEWLERYDFFVVKDTVGNLYGWRDGQGDSFLFSGHQDTVEPGRGIKVELKEGIIRSTGKTILGADNKASVAALLHAIQNTSMADCRPIEVVLSVGEENGLAGIQQFDFTQIKSKLGVCFDKSAPLGTMVMQSVEAMNFDGEIIGKAAHTGTPEKGINALEIGVQVLSEVKMGRNEDLLVNFSQINAGVCRNAVPDSFSFICEVRGYDELVIQQKVEDLVDLFQDKSKAMGSRLVYKTEYVYPTYQHDTHSMNARYIEKMLTKHGCAIEHVISGGSSDANFFNHNGISVYDLGDATINPHTTDERIALVDLEKMSQIMTRIMKDTGSVDD